MNDIKIVELNDFGKKRIAVLCLPGLESFLGDIVEHLRKTYTVTTCYSNNLAEIESVVKDVDLVFLEWGNQMAIETTQKLSILAEKKVILRIHSYEVLENFPKFIKFSVIDTILFVGEHIKDILCKTMPGLLNPDLNPPKLVVIPNGV